MTNIAVAKGQNDASWTRTKMAVAGPGIPYGDLIKMDIFEFFQVYTEKLAQSKKRDD